MKCLLLGTFTFPFGMAASARVRNLAYGFRNNGFDVYIYSLGPKGGLSENADEWILLDKNISYHHFLTSLDNNKWNNLAKNPLYLSTLQYQAYSKLKKITKDIKFDFVYIYGRGFISFLKYLYYFKSKKIPIVYDAVELPAIYKNRFELIKHPLRLDSVLGESFLIKKSNLITCISTSIQNRYLNFNTYLLPGIEEWDDLEQDTHYYKNNIFTIMYIGIFIEKDNPALMFKFCQKLKQANFNFILKFAGKYNGYTHSKDWVNKFQEEFPDRLILLNELDDKTLKMEITKSDAIFLLRQDNLSEENSFPTRLVEYLKNSIMVITSPKGDLITYLTHLNDSFLLPYNISDDIIHEWINLTSNKQDVIKMGKQGYITGKNNFNRDIHTKNIISMLNITPH